VSTTHCSIGAVICIGYATHLETAVGDSDRDTVAWGTGEGLGGQIVVLVVVVIVVLIVVVLIVVVNFIDC
jgi:hypothetical protein